MIKPLFANILIKPAEKEKKSTGGIYIPETVKEKPQLGEVLEVGDEAKKVKKGMKVLYPKWGGNEFNFENQEYIMIKEEDILAIA